MYVILGEEPLRRLTDVTAKVEKLDDFFAIEQKIMANETKTMADYHDLMNRGWREVYRIEN